MGTLIAQCQNRLCALPINNPCDTEPLGGDSQETCEQADVATTTCTALAHADVTTPNCSIDVLAGKVLAMATQHTLHRKHRGWNNSLALAARIALA
jgi:hypothetical protein